MKRLFTPLHNDSGFYFPIVLVVSILVVSFITMIIITYDNHIIIANSIIDQIKVNSIVQMVENDFSHDITVSDENGNLTYHYPNAYVKVVYNKVDDLIWNVHCEVFLENQTESHQLLIPVNIASTS